MNKLLIFVLALGLSSCATYEQQRAATTGAVLGGVAGAVIGSDSGRAIEGAAIGAAVGAATGAATATPRNHDQGRQHRHYNQGSVIVVPRGKREDYEHKRKYKYEREYKREYEDEHDD